MSKTKRIYTEEELDELRDEMIDRFGEPPASVVALLDVAVMKALAKQAMFSEISYNGEKVTCYFKDAIDFESVSGLISNYQGRILLSAGAKPYLTMKLNAEEKKNPTERIKSLLQCYIDLHTEEK